MTFEQLENQVAVFKNEGKRLFATSSFQTQSMPLLHMLSRLKAKVPIYFLNTGFLFAETLSFIDQVANTFNLEVVGLEPAVAKINQRDKHGNFLFVSDPDYCCELNKTRPLEPVLGQYDVWINGVRRDQSANRARFNTIEQTQGNAIRFHPLLDWTARDVHRYIAAHDLPKHPLHDKGYVSIGCEPCTRKYRVDETGRSGRWAGLTKTECGLHTDLVKKTK